jgi:hypothetical protein
MYWFLRWFPFRPRDPIPRSHWDRGNWFQGLIETAESDSAVSLRPWKSRGLNEIVESDRKSYAAPAVNNRKNVNKIENFCLSSVSAVSLRPRDWFPWSHWNRRIRFRGLIETAETDSELCKRLSQFSQRKRSHMQKGFKPWIKALGGIVWWKKLRVKNLVTLSL